MPSKTQQIVDILAMLPDEEQDFAYEMLKKIVLAWDPDYTKLAPEEAKRLEIGRQQLLYGEHYYDDEIDWDSLG